MSIVGYRTYAIAVLLGIAAAAKYLGFIDEAIYLTIISILAPAGLVTAAAHKP